jgi:hypothetical protein
VKAEGARAVAEKVTEIDRYAEQVPEALDGDEKLVGKVEARKQATHVEARHSEGDAEELADKLGRLPQRERRAAESRNGKVELGDEVSQVDVEADVRELRPEIPLDGVHVELDLDDEAVREPQHLVRGGDGRLHHQVRAAVRSRALERQRRDRDPRRVAIVRACLPARAGRPRSAPACSTQCRGCRHDRGQR